MAPYGSRRNNIIKGFVRSPKEFNFYLTHSALDKKRVFFVQI